VQELILADVDLDGVDHNGSTALMHAAEKKRVRRERRMKELLRRIIVSSWDRKRVEASNGWLAVVCGR
jgi:hypothetical protein